MTNTSKSTRILAYDMIRIAAIFAVVMIHSSSAYISAPVHTLDFFLGNIMESLSRIGVPLFIMLSGALLLNENKEFNFQKMKQYCIRIFILLYIWSFLFAIFYEILIPLVGNHPISIKEFLYSFIFGQYHQWYLFMIIGLYLITPILKLFIKQENRKYIEWFILLSIVFRFSVPIMNLLSNTLTNTTDIMANYVNQYSLQFADPNLTYFFLGWYFTNCSLSKKQKSTIYVLGFLALMTTILGNYLLPTASSVFYSGVSANTLFYAAALFLFLYSQEWKNVPTKWVNLLSKMSFGIYLVHPIWLTILKQLPISEAAIIRIPFNWIGSMVLSLVTVYIMSNIPFIKKLVKN